MCACARVCMMCLCGGVASWLGVFCVCGFGSRGYPFCGGFKGKPFWGPPILTHANASNQCSMVLCSRLVHVGPGHGSFNPNLHTMRRPTQAKLRLDDQSGGRSLLLNAEGSDENADVSHARDLGITAKMSAQSLAASSKMLSCGIHQR